jgi:hypothetical protein
VDRLWRMLENLEAGMIGLVSQVVVLVLVNEANLYCRTRAIPPRPSHRLAASKSPGMARSQARMWRSMNT